MSTHNPPRVKVKEPSTTINVAEATAVSAAFDTGHNTIDGSETIEDGVYVEQGELLPMAEGYPRQCWKVVGFSPTGVIVVADFYDDDHIIDYDSYDIEDHNYRHLSYRRVQELKE